MHLAVSELFGPTIQGEGPLVGHPAIFLRLMGCNLSCRWCDTPYTWDASRYDLKEQSTKMQLEDVAARIRQLQPTPMLLVVSGGEPMLQQEQLHHLLQLLPGQAVQIETAGTIAPTHDDRHTKYVVSPKLHHSGNNGSRYVPDAINALRDSGRVIAWKFVLAGDRDYTEVDWLVQHHQLAPVYIMAEGTDTWKLAQRLHQLAPGAIERGYRLTPRMHIDIFGNRRGV